MLATFHQFKKFKISANLVPSFSSFETVRFFGCDEFSKSTLKLHKASENLLVNHFDISVIFKTWCIYLLHVMFIRRKLVCTNCFLNWPLRCDCAFCGRYDEPQLPTHQTLFMTIMGATISGRWDVHRGIDRATWHGIARRKFLSILLSNTWN